MADILHRVGIKSSLDEVYKALATREGLAAWWTNNTQGESNIGAVLKFRFSAGGAEIGGFDMKILELQPAKRVLWQVVDGPGEWIGTKISLISNKPATMPLSSSNTRTGRSRWNSCAIAAPSGRFI